MSRKILFLITEDWFFRSHFLPLARRARSDGFEVVVAARSSGALASEDVRLIDTPFPRRSLGLFAAIRQFNQLRTILAAERPDIVHAIALRPIALLLMINAASFARVFALTGRGYLAIADTWLVQIVRWRFRRALRRSLEQPHTVLLVENEGDRRWLEAGGRKIADERVVLMPGAGVDIAQFKAQPPPDEGPVAVGIVARLIRSKGIDLAVEAVRRLRAQGANIVLRIAGGVDQQNPEHVSSRELAAWRATEGVELFDYVTDVPSFWAGAHIACLPSRGGEGLPRSLIEAAACGRPIVTTDTPGCADFIAASGAGLLVDRDDVDGLAQALGKLTLDAQLRRRMGAAGRAHVEAGYTEAHAARCAAEAWSRAADG